VVCRIDEISVSIGVSENRLRSGEHVKRTGGVGEEDSAGTQMFFDFGELFAGK